MRLTVAQVACCFACLSSLLHVTELPHTKLYYACTGTLDAWLGIQRQHAGTGCASGWPSWHMMPHTLFCMLHACIRASVMHIYYAGCKCFKQHAMWMYAVRLPVMHAMECPVSVWYFHEASFRRVFLGVTGWSKRHTVCMPCRQQSDTLFMCYSVTTGGTGCNSLQ